ncbi:hypothetical protein SAMN05421869_112333 [Nonomuraea jiangxiensis]|uniref:Uncharacterized protein n=1 Tax=Nonomuraea jiangxiensis TaxID=633440 RepID=A0A1G8X2B7_9ACTN|nr:hypothetical protein SAMN05421869_112333 [Nonomuraea jiangxiensis]
MAQSFFTGSRARCARHGAARPLSGLAGLRMRPWGPFAPATARGRAAPTMSIQEPAAPLPVLGPGGPALRVGLPPIHSGCRLWWFPRRGAGHFRLPSMRCPVPPAAWSLPVGSRPVHPASPRNGHWTARSSGKPRSSERPPSLRPCPAPATPGSSRSPASRSRTRRRSGDRRSERVRLPQLGVAASDAMSCPSGLGGGVPGVDDSIPSRIPPRPPPVPPAVTPDDQPGPDGHQRQAVTVVHVCGDASGGQGVGQSFGGMCLRPGR